MCLLPALGAIGSLATGAAVTASGASALAATGAIAGLGANIAGGINAASTARTNAALTQQRAATEAALTATQDARERRRFATQIRQQAAELVGRNIALDSPTALMLGDMAAREMAFQSQAIRSGGMATQAELSNQARMYRAQGQQALLTGALSGVGDLLTAAPKIWPGLLG